MYISSRVGATIYRLVLGVIAALGVWLQFNASGVAAWRLLATWVMLIASIYYILGGIFSLAMRRLSPGFEICPMLQGALVVSGIMLMIGAVIFAGCGMDLPGASGIGGVIVNFLVPVLMLVGWIFFSMKGLWRPIDPFNWLAFLVIYVGFVLLSSFYISQSTDLIYPYEILDYERISIATMLWWLVLFAVIDLIFGYLCVVIDFAMSGRLSETIVLPRIKTIVIEEDEAVSTVPEATKPSTTNAAQPVSSTKSPIALETKPTAPTKAPIVKINVEGLTDHKSAKNLHGKGSKSSKAPELTTSSPKAPEITTSSPKVPEAPKPKSASQPPSKSPAKPTEAKTSKPIKEVKNPEPNPAKPKSSKSESKKSSDKISITSPVKSKSDPV